MTAGGMLSEEQCRFFADNGYLVLDQLVPTTVTEPLRVALPEVFAQPHPGRVVEPDGKTVRTVHGTHMIDRRFAEFVRHPKLVRAARDLLGGDVYVYQFKVNAKEALRGDVW